MTANEGNGLSWIRPTILLLPRKKMINLDTQLLVGTDANTQQSWNSNSSRNTTNTTQSASIIPDHTTVPSVFVGVRITCVYFFLIFPKQCCSLPFSAGLSAPNSCYRWTGGDSDREVAPLLPFIIPSWRLRSGLTPALPLPSLFLSLHTAFLISLGHPI